MEANVNVNKFAVLSNIPEVDITLLSNRGDFGSVHFDGIVNLTLTLVLVDFT